MHILFTANDSTHGQVAAVWRCRDLLKSKYGIELFPAGTSEQHFYDLELAHTHNLPDAWWDSLPNGGPTILLERIDGPQLTGPVRKHIRNPLILAVIKNTIYDSVDRYNGYCWRGHQQPCMCMAAGKIPVYDTPTADTKNHIGPDEYKKLKLGFSFAAYPHMDPLKHLQPYELTGPRPYVLHFAGTTNYGPELDWLNWHRKAAVAEIDKTGLPAVNWPQRQMQFPEYFCTLRESQFCVSPWGLGESCYRDFEAILSGCMVIKPDCRHILTIPDPLYSTPPFKRFICKPDFSDLGQIAARTADRVEPGDLAQWARFVSEQNSTEQIAGRLARIFLDALK